MSQTAPQNIVSPLLQMEQQTVVDLRKTLRAFGDANAVGKMKKAQLIVEIRRRRAVQQIETDARRQAPVRRRRNIPPLARNVFRRELQARFAEREQRPLMMTVRVLRTSRRETDRSQFKNIRIPVVEGDLDVFVAWILDYQVSSTIGKKSGRFRFTGPASELRTRVDEVMAEFLDPFGEPYTILGVDVQLTAIRTNQAVPFTYTQSRMLARNPIDLSVNIFSNTIRIVPTDENCVKSYLRTLFPNISKLKKDPIGSLGNASGVSTDEIREFCEYYHIHMVAFSIDKKPIATNIPKHNDKKHSGLYFVSYQNHMYPINNRCLEQRREPINSIHLHSTALFDKFHEVVQSGILPNAIRLENNEISSFKHDDTLFFTNPEYDDCSTVLSQFGLESKLKPSTRYTNVLYEIEKAYSSTNLNSFFPVHHTKLPFWYNKEDVDTTRELETIDKNRAYSSILKNLPNLLTVDYRTTELLTFPFRLTENALYVATPEVPNILMPKQDIYCGRHLMYCQGKISFTLQEKLPCVEHKNIYSTLIPDLYDLCDPDIAKKIVVRTIGTFQTEVSVKEGVVAYIVSAEEQNPAYETLSVGPHTLELHKNKFVNAVSNRKPIAIQVKDQMSVLLYEKMLELKLCPNDIVQINTDSITFYKKSLRLTSQKNMDGWKLSSYSTKRGSVFENEFPFTTMKVVSSNQNRLITGYAGNGKTHYIQNNMDLIKSIILSSKHSALTQHRAKGLNAQVIQLYQFKNSVPDEDHIIVEEIGILDKQQWDILYKCFLLGKTLTCLGDYEQLLPVNETNTFSSKQFLSMMFSTQTRLETNYRNTFTPEYYRSLIDSKDQTYLMEQLLKHSTAKPEDAEVIICYRNTIVDKYNQYMMELLGNPEVYPMLCKTNELRDKDIYNGFILPSNEINKRDKLNFKPAFARTLYNLQGDQVKSYYLAPEDVHWFTQPRSAYTLISRLQQ